MSKFLATVTVLLYLCFSVQANKDICYEMINGLDKLNSLYKENRTNVSLPTRMNVPSINMQNNSRKCVGVFVKELKSVLGNVTVRNNGRDTLAEVQTLLQRLKVQQPAANGQQDVQACLMKPWIKSLTPFQQFINFLRIFRKTRL